LRQEARKARLEIRIVIVGFLVLAGTQFFVLWPGAADVLMTMVAEAIADLS
jgi:hypothetical protein